MPIPIRNDRQINSIASDFRKLYNPAHAWADEIGMALQLPNLRGLWNFSSVDHAGTVYDLSGQGRSLTKNGLISYGIEGLSTFADLDGSTGYFSRTDESGLDITGPMSILAWVRLAATPGVSGAGILAKLSSVTGYSYGLLFNASATSISFSISGDGSTLSSVSTTGTYSTGLNNWVFVAGTFNPGVSMDAWINDGKVSKTTSVPSSIHNSTSELTIGRYNNAAATSLNGDVGFTALYAATLSDTMIETFYDFTAPLYGVTP